MKPDFLILPQREPEAPWVLPQAALDFLGVVAEASWASLKPEAMAGNHYHKWRDELLVYQVPQRIWLYWGQPVKGSEVTIREIKGPVWVAFMVPAGWAQAVKNGPDPLVQTLLASRPLVPDAPDYHPYFLVS
ncbi:MAG: hypothetical protein RRB13_13790 [bacterium]|nr:hypothetical protein [bacterium]